MFRSSLVSNAEPGVICDHSEYPTSKLTGLIEEPMLFVGNELISYSAMDSAVPEILDMMVVPSGKTGFSDK